MIKKHFKIAFRSCWNHRLFTLINVIGLSVGISAALVIYLIIHFDFTFDNFHSGKERIYRVVTNYSFQGDPGYNSGVCGPLAIAAQTEATGIELVAPLFTLYQPNVFIPKDKNISVKFKNQDNVVLVDQQFFKLFNYTWLAGSSLNTMDLPNHVILTSEQARKYFPSLTYEQIIGKIVVYDTIKTTVTGIVKTITKNTDLTFHDFISYSTYSTNKTLKDQLLLTFWGGTSEQSQLFIKLIPNTSAQHVEAQLNKILKKNSKQEIGTTSEFHLQPLKDLHFNQKYNIYGSRIANKATLYSLLAIGIFLLLLGCINFINLTTAQSTHRAKEIGVRKTMGSSRMQLVHQFLIETFLITLISVIISIGLVPIILQLFSDFIPTGITAGLLIQPNFIGFLIGLTLVVSLLSGSYPAIILSSYKPVLILKNQFILNGRKSGNAYLRKSLTVIQFVIAQFFIIATVLVGKQINYILHKDLGFKKDAIVIIHTPWKSTQSNKRQFFFNELRSLPQIALISLGKDAPSSNTTISTDAIYKDGKIESKIQLEVKYGDENYIKVYGIKLVAGRDLEPTDTSKALLVNETYAKLISFNNPLNAVGKEINKFDGHPMKIVGVVADFNQKSLHSPIKPLAILTSNEPYLNGTFHIALRPESLEGEEWKKAITAISEYWRVVYPDEDFSYQFFDESISKFYETEQHEATLLSWATGLSIFISCMGLLGLAIYTINRRSKEIGVRKVLGASIAQIVSLLSTEMILLILCAFVIVTPIAWWAGFNWMQGFADRTAISWWIFALSGLGMLVVAVLISGFQLIKAALTNPVKSLRSD